MTTPSVTAPRPAPRHGVPQPAIEDASIGQLASQLGEQVSRLVRDELALAQNETKTKAKRLGVGAGMFGGAAVLGWFAVGVLVAAAVLGLATAVDAWLAALIVAGVLLVLAGSVALMGKKNVAQGSPPVPKDAIGSVHADVDAVRDAVAR